MDTESADAPKAQGATTTDEATARAAATPQTVEGMEMPEPSFPIASALLLVLLAISLLVIALISPLERRLVAGAALLLAGFFLLARPGLDLPSALLGAGTWALGAGVFFHAGFNWTRAQATKVGPLAVVFVLPAAFLGAILLGGIVLSILTGPVRLVLRLVGA